MDNETITIICTTINVCLTAFNAACAVHSSIHTRKQTKLMEKQLEASLEPDFALTGKLEGIQKAIYHVGDTIKKAIH